jgi:heat shock protein HslJ
MSPQSTSLVGTWEVTGINNGRQALVGVLGDPKVDMTFTADGKVAGSAGCNRFNAQFKASGDSLRFTPAATTRRMCPGDVVMEQEQIFLAALNMVSTARMDGNTLEMRRPDGEMALLLRRVPK